MKYIEYDDKWMKVLKRMGNSSFSHPNTLIVTSDLNQARILYHHIAKSKDKKVGVDYQVIINPTPSSLPDMECGCIVSTKDNPELLDTIMEREDYNIVSVGAYTVEGQRGRNTWNLFPTVRLFGLRESLVLKSIVTGQGVPIMLLDNSTENPFAKVGTVPSIKYFELKPNIVTEVDSENELVHSVTYELETCNVSATKEFDLQDELQRIFTWSDYLDLDKMQAQDVFTHCTHHMHVLTNEHISLDLLKSIGKPGVEVINIYQQVLLDTFEYMRVNTVDNFEEHIKEHCDKLREIVKEVDYKFVL